MNSNKAGMKLLREKGWSRKRLIWEKRAPGKPRGEGIKISNSGESLLGKLRAEKDKFWKILTQMSRAPNKFISERKKLAKGRGSSNPSLSCAGEVVRGP